MRSSASPLVERMLTTGSSRNHTRRCSLCCQHLNSHSDGGRGSRLLAFFIFKRKCPMVGCFWSSAVKCFHKWGNHGGNSDVLGASQAPGSLGRGLGKMAPLAHEFVVSGTRQVIQLTAVLLKQARLFGLVCGAHCRQICAEGACWVRCRGNISCSVVLYYSSRRNLVPSAFNGCQLEINSR